MGFNDNFGRPNNYYSQMQNNAYNGNFQPQMAIQQPQPQMRTNKLYVTSLEDALNRFAEPNTVIVYRHQDEKFEYEITTDAQGKKTYKTFVLGDYLAQNQAKEQEPITNPTEDVKKDLEAIKSRIKVLEEELLKNYKEQRKIEKKGGLE